MKRGFYGIGIYAPCKSVNLGTLWRHAHAFDADFIFTIGAKYKYQSSDTSDATKHIPYYPHETLSDFYKSRPINCRLIGVELTECAMGIKNFVHPERAIYILGPENGSLGKKILSQCQYIIKIPTQFCLNVAGAGTIVCYDRKIKS